MHKTGSTQNGPLACSLASALLVKKSVGGSLVCCYPVSSSFGQYGRSELFCSIHRVGLIVYLPRAGKGLSGLTPTLKFSFLLYFVLFCFPSSVRCLLCSTMMVLLIF